MHTSEVGFMELKVMKNAREGQAARKAVKWCVQCHESSGLWLRPTGSQAVSLPRDCLKGLCALVQLVQHRSIPLMLMK